MHPGRRISRALQAGESEYLGADPDKSWPVQERQVPGDVLAGFQGDHAGVDRPQAVADKLAFQCPARVRLASAQLHSAMMSECNGSPHNLYKHTVLLPLYEIKFDGYRCLARVENGVVQMRTKSGTDSTRWYQRLARRWRGCRADRM